MKYKYLIVFVSLCIIGLFSLIKDNLKNNFLAYIVVLSVSFIFAILTYFYEEDKTRR